MTAAYYVDAFTTVIKWVGLIVVGGVWLALVTWLVWMWWQDRRAKTGAYAQPSHVHIVYEHEDDEGSYPYDWNVPYDWSMNEGEDVRVPIDWVREWS